MGEVEALAPSGTKLVPSQPSAISPVSSSILGDSEARYTGTEIGGRLTRIGRAPLDPASGMRYWVPAKLTFSPVNTLRTIATVSRMRASG